MNKKIIAVLLSIIIISSCCLNCFVYADDVTTIYYLSNVVDFTRLQAGDYNTDLNNYNLNFNDVSGYLKNDINYGDGTWTGSNFSNVFVNNNLIDNWVNSVNNDYTVSNQNTVNFKGVESPDIVVNGDVLDRSHYKTIIATDGGANMPSGNYIIVCSVYVPDDTICFLEQGRLMTSKNDVYYSYNIYQFYADGDYLSFSKWGNTSSGTNSYYTTYDFDQDNTPDLYQLYVTLNGWFYSDIPVYYTWANHSDGEGAFLNQSPYYYGDYTGRGGSTNSVGKYVLNGLDDTGFILDRRTSQMKNTGGNSVSPSDYGFKEGSFGNILYGGSYDNQKLMVGYELNDQSKSIQNQLALKLNYRYIFDGTLYNLPIYYDEDYYTNRGGYDIYSLKETNYINIDLSKVFWYMIEHDQTYRDNLATVLDLKTNVLINGGYRHKVVDGTPLYLFDILKSEDILTEYVQNNDYDQTFFESVSVTYKDVTISPKFNINSIFEGEHSQTYTNTINNAQLIVTESILNLQTNEESSPCTFVYNYVNGSYNYIGTLETSGELFNNSYEYGGQSKNGYTSSDLGYDLSTYSFYPSSVSQGGNASSTGNIVNVYPSQYPYVLVDIPENEWMSKTPNLTSILTDFKSMLAETKEDSVLTMLPQTYNYFPAPVMQYLLYGVGLIVMVGIWRAITRR